MQVQWELDESDVRRAIEEWVAKRPPFEGAVPTVRLETHSTVLGNTLKTEVLAPLAVHAVVTFLPPGPAFDGKD